MTQALKCYLKDPKRVLSAFGSDFQESQRCTHQSQSAPEQHHVCETTPPRPIPSAGVQGIASRTGLCSLQRSHLCIDHIIQHLHIVSIQRRGLTRPQDGLSEIDEEAFSATVGEFFPRGPDTENVVPQHVVAGAACRHSVTLLTRN